MQTSMMEDTTITHLSVIRRVQRSSGVQYCLLGKIEQLRHIVEFLSGALNRRTLLSIVHSVPGPLTSRPVSTSRQVLRTS